MNLAEIAREIELLAGQGSVIMDEPMEFHTSFRVGGPPIYWSAREARKASLKW